MADWRSASMWAPPDWLQIYSVARLCRRAKFSKDLVLTLMSWVQLPANAPMDTSRHPLFFAHWCGNGDPCCDDKKRNPHRKLQHKPCHAGLYVIMSICLPCKLFADLELGLGNNGI